MPFCAPLLVIAALSHPFLPFGTPSVALLLCDTGGTPWLVEEHGEGMNPHVTAGLHAAPEVTLRFDPHCATAVATNWKLSSRDVPPGPQVIPHGGLWVEVHLGVAPADFVELLWDGKPLAPTSQTDGGLTIQYTIPCPALGRHLLQARYRKDHLWSEPSAPLMIFVQLPPPPRIVGIADSRAALVPVTRHAIAPIRSSELKVYLADVNPSSQFAAYIDGSPVAIYPSEAACCQLVRVAGAVTPGVHTLTVRSIPCAAACSLASLPSNPVQFHYYDEAVYVLQPGMRCPPPGPLRTAPSEAIGPAEHLLAAPLASPGQSDQAASRIGSNLERRLSATWDVAELKALQKRLNERIGQASRSEGNVDVLRALDQASAEESRAERESAKAEARVREGIARANAERLAAIQGPASPFTFASAAHFPLSGAGLRGDRIDREGLLIYEDMALHFDREGNYEVRFRATAPELPVTLRLQFQIQPYAGGPWYTLTLPPIQFRYCRPMETPKLGLDGHCDQELLVACEAPRATVCRGHSEILRRCYGELGTGASIRRSGTARFGFGVAVP